MQLVIASGGISPQARETSLVWVLGSGSGSNLKALIQDAKNSDAYKIAGVITDRACGCEELACAHDLPHVRIEREPGAGRDAFDQRIIDALVDKQVDFLVLAGYKRLVGSRILDCYRDRIINVHPGDLLSCDAQGKRRYTGLDAVAKALAAGEKQTRSCVINVTAEMDGGAVLVSGPWVAVQKGVAADAHQERQKAESDWPALCTALRLLASGRATINDGVVFIDGKVAGPAGYEMHKEKGKQQCVGS